MTQEIKVSQQISLFDSRFDLPTVGVFKSQPSVDEYSAEFERFWTAYPRKKGKGGAYNSFKRFKCHTILEKIINAIEKEKKEKSFLKSKGRFCPEWKHPTTWLNQKCWLDEHEEVTDVKDWKGMSIEEMVDWCDNDSTARRECFKDIENYHKYLAYKHTK